MKPHRGELWLADLEPVRGHEQGGRRPVLVVSVDLFNQGPAGLAIVIPLTSKDKGIPSHVRVEPPEGGLRASSVIQCEAIRSISSDRLVQSWGRISPETLERVEDWLRTLLQL